MSKLEVVPTEMRIAGRQTVVESDTTLVPAPSLDAIAATVRHEHDLVIRASQKLLEHIALCGDALREAKQRIPRGEWLNWLGTARITKDQASLYMRASLHADVLREHGVETVTGIRAFLAEHALLINNAPLSDERVEELKGLRTKGFSLAQIQQMTGIHASVVHNYTSKPNHGKGQRARYARRAGRKAKTTQQGFAITDDLIEGAALKLRELLGPGSGSVTDADRDTAVEVLRAAFTYDGPIPGENQ